MQQRKIFITFILLLFPGLAEASFFDGLLSHKGVNPIKMPLYEESCGECHFAYQPGLLPERSWKKMMLPQSLENHFGDNAELPEDDRMAILKYVMEYAADHSLYKRSVKIFRSINEDVTPLKISEVPYIKRKHAKIPNRMITGNKAVRLLSNCNACHTKASTGSFDDDSVFIPNFGYWDD